METRRCPKFLVRHPSGLSAIVDLEAGEVVFWRHDRRVGAGIYRNGRLSAVPEQVTRDEIAALEREIQDMLGIKVNAVVRSTRQIPQFGHGPDVPRGQTGIVESLNRATGIYVVAYGQPFGAVQCGPGEITLT
jgi:hypothetical protein